jgi:hypothetical protein
VENYGKRLFMKYNIGIDEDINLLWWGKNASSKPSFKALCSPTYNCSWLKAIKFNSSGAKRKV